MLDGALGADARARRACLGVRARPWIGKLSVHSHLLERCARRGKPEPRHWGVGRGEPIHLREHRRSAPRVITVPNELTNECLWGGSAPPNGSRLSCGRPASRRKGVGRQSVPARAQHSGSTRTITARQLQAHVRRRASPRISSAPRDVVRATRPPAQECWTTVRARQGTNTPFPLGRSTPVSFKRLLDGSFFKDLQASAPYASRSATASWARALRCREKRRRG